LPGQISVDVPVTTRISGSMAKKRIVTGGKRMKETRRSRVSLPRFPGSTKVETGESFDGKEGIEVRWRCRWRGGYGVEECDDGIGEGTSNGDAGLFVPGVRSSGTPKKKKNRSIIFFL
jgi:hypothetical protein